MKRRSFLSATGGGFACACTGAVVGGCSMITGTSGVAPAPAGSYSLRAERLVLALSRIDALKSPGGAAKLAVSVGPEAEPIKVLIVRPDEERFLAFEDRCTHGRRELDYRHAEGRIECSSFGHSRFDLGGRVLKGPADAPLTVFACTEKGGELVVVLRDLSPEAGTGRSAA